MAEKRHPTHRNPMFPKDHDPAEGSQITKGGRIAVALALAIIFVALLLIVIGAVPSIHK